MLEKVGFKNFLALRDVELTLEPFTVIVGPNASGKSSILEGIRRTIKAINYGVSSLFNESETSAPVFNFRQVQFRNSSSTEITFYLKRNLQVYLVRVSLQNELVIPRVEESTLAPNQISTKTILFARNDAARVSYSENLKPILENTGAGLATVCSYLQSVKPEKFTWIQQQMQVIIPNLLKFRIEPAKVAAKDWFNISDQNKYLEDIISRRSGTGHQLIFDFVNASDISVDYISDGTLFALVVLVAVASSEGETVLLIDDLERGLHPSAVREMIKALREIQKITPELQIVATSHSPYILDKLEPREVRVTAFDPEIGTMVASLEEYPSFEKWRDAMTPGEFWSFVGEDWVKKVHAERAHV
jgi:AAA15 family ATPase/GTPase